MTVEEPTIEAVVFDFDGLILDTEGPVFVAWQEEFEAHGCPPLTVEEWAAEIGTTGGLDLVELIRTRATRPFEEEAMHAIFGQTALICAFRARRSQAPMIRSAVPPLIPG